MCETMPKKLLASELHGTLISLNLPGQCVATLVARVVRREGRWRRSMQTHGRDLGQHLACAA